MQIQVLKEFRDGGLDLGGKDMDLLVESIFVDNSQHHLMTHVLLDLDRRMSWYLELHKHPNAHSAFVVSTS